MTDASVADPSCHWQDPSFDSDHHSFYYGVTLQVLALAIPRQQEQREGLPLELVLFLEP